MLSRTGEDMIWFGDNKPRIVNKLQFHSKKNGETKRRLSFAAAGAASWAAQGSPRGGTACETRQEARRVFTHVRDPSVLHAILVERCVDRAYP